MISRLLATAATSAALLGTAALTSACCIPIPLGPSTDQDLDMPDLPELPDIPKVLNGPKAQVTPLPPSVMAGWGDLLDDRARRNVIPQLDDREALFARLTERPPKADADGSFAGVLLCDLRVASKGGLFRGRPDMRATIKLRGETLIANADDNRDAAVVSLPVHLADGDRFELLLDDRDLFRDDRLDAAQTSFPGSLPFLFAGAREKLRATCLGLPAEAVARRLQEALPAVAPSLKAFEDACVVDRAAPGWGYPSAEAWTQTKAIEGVAALVGWQTDAAPALAAFRDARGACKSVIRDDIAAARDAATSAGEPLSVGDVTVIARRRLCGPAVEEAFKDDPGLARPCVLELEVVSKTGGPLPREGSARTLDLVFGDGRIVSLTPYARLEQGAAVDPVALRPDTPDTVWYIATWDGRADTFTSAAFVRLTDGKEAALGALP